MIQIYKAPEITLHATNHALVFCACYYLTYSYNNVIAILYSTSNV